MIPGTGLFTAWNIKTFACDEEWKLFSREFKKRGWKWEMQIGRWALPAQNKPMNAWQIALDYDCAVCSEIFSHYINKPAICNLPWPHQNRFYFAFEIRCDHAPCNIFRQHSISYSMKRLPHAIEIVKVTTGNKMNFTLLFYVSCDVF